MPPQKLDHAAGLLATAAAIKVSFCCLTSVGLMYVFFMFTPNGLHKPTTMTLTWLRQG